MHSGKLCARKNELRRIAAMLENAQQVNKSESSLKGTGPVPLKAAVAQVRCIRTMKEAWEIHVRPNDRF